MPLYILFKYISATEQVIQWDNRLDMMEKVDRGL